jgi:hypothetical protein
VYFSSRERGGRSYTDASVVNAHFGCAFRQTSMLIESPENITNGNTSGIGL